MALVATALGAWTLARATVDPVVEIVPGPAPLAVPVERRVLETAVVDRGTVEYSGRVTVPLPAMADGSVLTWAPDVDARIESGDVLVEVDGRPSFALPGPTPMYRTLERGTVGRDVVQFQEAMVSLDLREDPPTGKFDRADEHAAASLYFGAGYEPETEWTPGGGSTLTDRWRLLTGGVLECPEPCEGEIAEIRDRLVELYAAARIRIPAAEVAFVEGLPRRVGSRPQSGSDPSIELTGEALVARVATGATRANSVKLGIEAVVDLDDGSLETTGDVTDISLGSGDEAGLWVVSITLHESFEELVGQGVRVRIPLVSSNGAVLAVPLSALAAHGDGSTSVTVQEPDGSTRRVTVRAGLVADGYVEVEASEGELSADDYVVVSQQDG